MKEFFVNEKIGIPFHLFDLTHISLILVLVITLTLIILNRNNLSNIKNKKRLKILFAVILLSNMCILYGSYLLYGVYDWKLHLPLHFCFITGNLFSLSMIFNLKKLYKVTYFWVFVGPLPAIIWPDNTSCFDNYLFYHYIISHHCLLIFNLIVYYMERIKIEKKDIFKSLLCANVVFGIMIIFNMIFGTNYIMSQELPEHIIKLYPFLKAINYPILLLELTGLVVMIISYIPVYFRNKEYKKIGEL